jgi:hypothetical protein
MILDNADACHRAAGNVLGDLSREAVCWQLKETSTVSRLR